MATESLVFPGPPSLTNGYDAQDYTLGARFSLVAPQDCSGLVWERTPDDVSHTPTGGQWIATLWNWDTQAIIASIPFTPLAAVKQEIPFGASFPLVNGVNYAATVFTQDYVFLAASGDIFTPSLNVAADGGVIGVSSSPTAFPAGQPASWYFVGPRMETGGTEPAEGTVDVGLDLAVAATGSRASAGVAAAGVALAVAASGARPSRGAVAVVIDLAVSAAGARASRGAAALGVNLAVNAAGPVAAVAGGGPRLVTVSRAARLTSVTRPDPVTTSTRG